MKNVVRLLILAGAVGTAAIGCGSTPVPADKYARSRAAIRSAETLKAEQHPAASVHLRLAREQLAHATQMLKDGENERARVVLVRAEADANTAAHLAREAWAVREAQETIGQVSQLRAQMEETQP